MKKYIFCRPLTDRYKEVINVAKEWSKQVFSRNLSRYIADSGKTQKELADIIGVSAPTFNEWVSGKKFPRIDKIQKLADYFGILKSDLIEEKVTDAIDARPIQMAELHFEMIEDLDLNEIFEDFRTLNARDRQTVKDLVHSLAHTKTEA